MAKFRVLRRHDGDKAYFEGDIREADESSVKHLIGRVLEKIPTGGAVDAPSGQPAPLQPVAEVTPSKRRNKRG